ncbi:hypothetical protein [Parafrankia soli]|uniref:hypothetical protein n=1 Tax=Parafrankia soli TaxID=2599596 RepID=UPI000B15E5C0|nr:hypothetical protein [Parafrankia soli]
MTDQVVAAMERHQVAFYLGAIAAGDLLRSLRAGRFLAATLTVNFLAVPLVVAAMFPFLPDNQALRLGVLLVLLCPCVDYVIVFSGLAGARNQQLLAATPCSSSPRCCCYPCSCCSSSARGSPTLSTPVRSSKRSRS